MPHMVLIVIAAALTAVIALIAPQQLPVTLYKLSLVSVAAIVGYWIDRVVFPSWRPKPGNPYIQYAMLRRAIIIAAAVLGVCLGA